jgi:alpha-beta hydrolase superfamily lysophospholipase
MTIDAPALRHKYEGPHHLITTSDGKTLFLRMWEPSAQTLKDSAVLIFHGITAHSGPYSMLADPLTRRGFTVYGLDLRGHGLSDGNRGDYPSKERFVKDLCETIAFVKERHPKVVILGHSLGVLSSVVALNNCLENIDGAVLLSGARTVRPGVYPQPSRVQKLKIVLSSLASPSKPVIKYGRDGMVGRNDPLFNFRYTLRFMRIAALRQMAFPKTMSFPVFVGVGDSDELFSIEACRELYEEVPSEVKEFHIAVGGKHAEFPQGSWNPLMEWLEKHFS